MPIANADLLSCDGQVPLHAGTEVRSGGQAPGDRSPRTNRRRRTAPVLPDRVPGRRLVPPIVLDLRRGLRRRLGRLCQDAQDHSLRTDHGLRRFASLRVPLRTAGQHASPANTYQLYAADKDPPPTAAARTAPAYADAAAASRPSGPLGAMPKRPPRRVSGAAKSIGKPSRCPCSPTP